MHETDDELLERVVGQMPAGDEPYILCRHVWHGRVVLCESTLCDSPKRCAESKGCQRSHGRASLTLLVPEDPLGVSMRVDRRVPKGELWFEQGDTIVAKIVECDSA